MDLHDVQPNDNDNAADNVCNKKLPVKYERVVGRPAHVETSADKNWEGILADGEKQRVVAERRHGDADLRQVVKVHEKHRDV